MEDFAIVSLIDSTKNEEKNIGRCLDSLLAQTYPNIEIIVVDNNSKDKTKEIASTKGAKVYNYGPERSAQRNYGMLNKSQGKFVTQIIHFVGGEKRTFENVESEYIKQGQFTKLMTSDGRMILVNDKNVLCIEVFKQP